MGIGKQDMVRSFGALEMNKGNIKGWKWQIEMNKPELEKTNER